MQDELYTYVPEVSPVRRLHHARPAGVVQLRDTQRRRLHSLRYDPALKPRERDQSGLLLSADGMRATQLTAYFGCCQATGRRWLH